MPNDVGVLTSILNTFTFVITGGFARLWPSARWLLETLAIIEIALAALWWMLSREDIIAGLIQRILWFGFFIWMVLQFPHLIDVIRDSFVQAGLTAGGTSITVEEFTNPSQIATFGMIATEPIFQHIADYSAVGAMRNLGDIIVTGLAGLLIVLAFFIIAIQVFITLIEFYLFAVVALLLIPFGVNRHTSFIAERVIGAVISFGVKLMVLAFVASIGLPVLATLNVPPDPELRQVLSLLLASLALAALTWHAPAIAAGLLAGTPSLAAGVATGAVAAGVFGAAAVSSAGRSGAGVIAGGGRAAIGGAQGVTRIASTAGYAAHIGARNPDGGSFGRVGSAMRHVERVAFSSAGRSIAKSRVAQGFRNAVAQGRVAGQGGKKP
ncbi:MAG: P-type conjugative transfer protein TrbL [Candidatus Tectomicrobia bacterium]